MNFKESLKKLEEAGKLVRIESEVDLVHEMAGVAKKFEGKQVVLFERLKGQQFPLAVGVWWNRDNLGTLFDCRAEELPELFSKAVQSLSTNPVNPVIVENASAQQVVFEEPDLSKIPVPTLALKDGGPYFDNCVVTRRENGI